MDTKPISANNDVTEVFYEIREGEYIQFNMTLPIQMLFDDIVSFVSIADC